MRKRRPPLTTAEIHAYNYGVRARARGLTPDALALPGIVGVAVPFDLGEAEAEERLGSREFARWALRGWWAVSAEEDREA